jgi:two-component system LytT family sensor kinase
MRDDAALIRFDLSNKYFRIIIHVLVWLAMLAFPFILDTSENRSWHDLFFDSKNYWFRLRFISYFYWIALFYINIYLLVPYLFNRKKYIYFSVAALAMYALCIFCDSRLFVLLNIPVHFSTWITAYIKLPAFLLTMAASTMYIMIADRIKEELRSSETDKENLKSELSFLRSQISPHFIFNILNNIAAMVRLKSEELEPTVMKLSGLMQYMLYNTDDDRVSLAVEAEYLKSYIDLQKHRFGTRVNVQVTFEILDHEKQIEPMLLIPFVENAFKHGIGVIENPTIIVVLKADNRKLNFSVINNFNDIDNKQKDSSSGIGIVNVTRRLQLLYGDRHKLSIQKKETCFTVSLSLDLDPNELHSS